jgi:hypothetical protein
LVLPACYVAASLILRTDSGPFWLWFNLDPDYFYLLDALNLVNLTTPGHVAHPGTTVQVLGALVLKAGYPALDAEVITATVLDDPEFHLRRISTAIIGLNAAALAAAGIIGYSVFASFIPALLLQTAPFLSMLTLKHGFHAKPEALLVFAVLVLFMIVVMALRPGVLNGELEGKRNRYAIAFGLVAGFAVATKLTAAPIFVLPLVLLGNFRAIAVYGFAALLAVVLFTLPAAGGYGDFLNWNWQVLKGSGAYGSGEATVIDMARYPADVAKLLRRPVVSVVLVLSLAAVAASWRRARKSGQPLPAPVLALAGVCLAQAAQVLVVAKQPAAHYMIPSYMLSALSLALLHQILHGVSGRPKRVSQGFALLLAVLVAAQGGAVYRQDREFRQKTEAALAPEGRFEACTRIYFYAASSRSYALLLADLVTGGRFAGRLQSRLPGGDYWFEDWYKHLPTEIRDAAGPRTAASAINGAPCLMIRGTTPVHALAYLKETAPGFEFDTSCGVGDETILLKGARCDGSLTGPPPQVP